jgi:hypothetical protein
MAEQPLWAITTLPTENFSVAAVVAAHNAAIAAIYTFGGSGSTPEKLTEQYAKLFKTTYVAIQRASD